MTGTLDSAATLLPSGIQTLAVLGPQAPADAPRVAAATDSRSCPLAGTRPRTRAAAGLDQLSRIRPNTVFVHRKQGQFDSVIAMYHDQGHIPLKLCGFKLDPKTGLFTSMSGINTTIGLPIIRTSVDHGTAFDRAGKNIANEESMLDAIRLAIRMARHKA